MMTRVTIDAATLAKLQRSLGDLVEMCDEGGNTVGYFYHFLGPPRDAAGKVISPVSNEELERRSRRRSGRPLKDILDDLQKQ